MSYDSCAQGNDWSRIDKNQAHLRNSSMLIRDSAIFDMSKSVAQPRQYKLSVREMVKASRKGDDEWGISGYECREVIVPGLENKKPGFLIAKDSGKPYDYISML